MNDQQRAAMQMALEWFEWCLDDKPAPTISARGIAASLREVLAQPQDHSEQHLNMVKGEPVAWISAKESFCGFPKLLFSEKYKDGYKPVYLTPPSVEAAIEATKEEFIEIVRTIGGKFAQEAEAAIRGMK